MKELQALIMSLTPVEKQNFKKRHKASADFILLFDYLNKKSTIDREKLISYLSKKSESGKKYTTSYIAVLRSYLQNKILESLRIQSIHKKKKL